VNERRNPGSGPDAAPSGDGSTPAAGFGPLETTVKAQAARIDELARAYAALLDDNKAFRQRVERERERLVDAEKTRLAQVMLESHDDLERAYRASGTAVRGEPASLRDLREGVALSLASMEKRITEMGVTRIEVVGTPYDPRTAEAIDVAAVEDPAQDGAVLEEFRPGWRIGDRVLRPARVRVGRLSRA
jgi:molecular chaperone GrpE